MKFGTKLQYECPDTCKSCLLLDDTKLFGQNSICTQCPVFNCQEPVTEEDRYYMPLIPANQFRDDWAKEWDKFFKTGEEPQLMLFLPKGE